MYILFQSNVLGMTVKSVLKVANDVNVASPSVSSFILVRIMEEEDCGGGEFSSSLLDTFFFLRLLGSMVDVSCVKLVMPVLAKRRS